MRPCCRHHDESASVVASPCVTGSVCPCPQPVLGKLHSRPARLDKKLARELKALASNEDPYDTLIGKTMCTYDFYEGGFSLRVFNATAD